MINYTFIIPHHNCPDLLNRLLDSIPQREDIEIIVVDDNSDQNKQPQISRSDVQIVLISKEKSKGAGHARNVGLGLAKGKWILFADSDDKYINGVIDELDKFEDSDAEIVMFSAYIGYNKSSELSDKKNYIERHMDEFETTSKQKEDIQRLTMKHSFPWNKMIKRDYINSINAQFEEVPMRNDAWFSKYIGLHASKVEYTSKRLYCYYIYENNTTNKKRPLKDYLKTIGTTAKINLLLFKNKLLELGVFPGFYVKNIMRDYGIFTVIILFVYEFLRDPITIPVIMNKLYRHIKRKIHLK